LLFVHLKIYHKKNKSFSWIIMAAQVGGGISSYYKDCFNNIKFFINSHSEYAFIVHMYIMSL